MAYCLLVSCRVADKLPLRDGLRHLVDIAAQFIWKDISNLWSTTRVMAQPTQRLGASLGYVRICFFCRQNVYLRCDFLCRLALFWLFKHLANLMASNSGPLFCVCAYEMNLRQKPRFSPSTCRRLLRQAAYRDAPHRSEPIHLFTPSHETRIHFRHAAARPI
jgi:hypothetical protein